MLWLQHPKVSVKFYAIAVLFSAPVILLGYLFVDQSLKDIRFAERERAGVAYLTETWPLFQHAVAEQDPTADHLAKVSAAAGRYDPLMSTADAREHFLQAPAGRERVEAGQDFIQKIADGSWLTLDPDLDSYYMMDVVTIKLPDLIAAATALTDATDRPSSLKGVAGDRATEVSLAAARLLRATSAMGRSIGLASGGNADGSLKAVLTMPLQKVLADADRLAQSVAPLETASTASGASAADTSTPRQDGQALQAGLDTLWQASRQELDRLLVLRIDGLKSRLETNLAIAGLLVAAVLTLMAAISHSIARRLNQIAATMDAMRHGELEAVVPHLRGRDEIGAIARTLEHFRERLISLRAFEGDLIAQEARRAAETGFRDILDVSPIGVVITTTAGTPLYANSGYTAILGAEAGSTKAAAIWSGRLEGDATVRDLEMVLERGDGSSVTCLLSGEPIQYDGKAAALRWVYDITERKKAEAEVRSAQSRLVQSEKLASLGQLTAGIAHEIKNPLNFVNNFSELSVDLLGELKDALNTVALDDAARSEVEDLTAMIGENLGKVVQHGKRADSIVKNMLLHSREGSGESRSTDFNATVREALNLAYHGARAEKPGFQINLVTAYDPDAGAVDMYPQEFTRVLLNLMSNGFYAVDKRRLARRDQDFEGTLTVTTSSGPERVEVRIADNGTGIAHEVKTKLFTPFFTTKPPGEGTGLGLSLSHDIIVKQHGGTIDLKSEIGEGTEFIVSVPRRHAGELKRAS